jgi:hypothetical protein
MSFRARLTAIILPVLPVTCVSVFCDVLCVVLLSVVRCALFCELRVLYAVRVYYFLHEVL